MRMYACLLAGHTGSVIATLLHCCLHIYQRRLARGMLLALAVIQRVRIKLSSVKPVAMIRTATTAAATVATTVASVATTAAVAGHLGKARVNLLLGLGEDVD